jgi:simple sugar transport system permease protein
MNTTLKSIDNFWRSIRAPLLAIAGGLLIGGVIMLLAGYNALDGYSALLDGAFGGKNSANLLATLVRSAPIVGLALAASVAFKAGFFNIGLEGQMVLGAITSTLVAIYSPFPTLITAILVVLSAILVAGGYALISAWLDVRFSIPIFISSLLLNYPARFFSTYLVNHPFRDVTTGMVETHRIPEALQIPKLIPNTQFHIGVLFVPILVIATAFIFKFTKIGYKIRLCGYNKNFLEYGGVHIKQLEYRVVFVSGAIAGIIGLLEVFGLRYRFIPGMLTSPLYAWTAVTTAILANSDPIGVLLAGFMLAAIQNGGFGMERMSDVPREISRVIQSIIIMIVSTVSVLRISSSVSQKED